MVRADLALLDASGFDWMKEAALLFFFGLFMVVLLRLLLGGRNRYEKPSQIPLTDDVVEPRNEH
ncbi:MAG: hypothetical protein AAFZ65_13975 [Planctomycetota bacterium]